MEWVLVLNNLEVNGVINELNKLAKSLENKRFNNMHMFHEQVKEATGDYLSSLGLNISSWEIYSGYGASKVNLLGYMLDHVQDNRTDEEKERKGRIKSVTFKPLVKIEDDTTFGEVLLLSEKESLEEVNKNLLKYEEERRKEIQESIKYREENAKRIMEIEESLRAIKTAK